MSTPSAPSSDARPNDRDRVGERASLLWVIGIAVVALIESWITRAELNPDGVSYIDLADAIRAGDFGAFVQGYWSPLYPLLLAPVRAAASAVGVSTLGAVHFANALIVVAGALVFRRLAYLENLRPAFTRSAWATYAMCVLVFTRINSVTPDALLLVFILAAASEILRRSSARWWMIALSLGAACLAKTSIWPWLALMLAALLTPWSGITRLTAVRAAGGVAGILLIWIIPMSVKAGAPTLGSTARLNACWFLRACDSRSPDTHAGDHVAYGTLPSGPGAGVTFARFGGDRWTWAPWSDPTAWSAGVRSHAEEPLTASRYAAIVSRNVWEALRFLAQYLYLAVLLPLGAWWWLGRARASMSRDVASALLLSCLGAIGIAQFVAVQVQPRLMAPFALLHVLALVVALRRAASDVGGATRAPSTHDSRAHEGARTPSASRAERKRNKKEASRESGGAGERLAPAPNDGALAVAASWIPPVAAAFVVGVGLRGEWVNARSTAEFRDTLLSTTTLATHGFADRHVVIVGEAFGLLPHARALDARVVAQVRPQSLDALGRQSARDRQSALRDVGGGRGAVAWRLRGDGRVEITPLR